MNKAEEDLANQKEESQEKKLRGGKVSDAGECLWRAASRATGTVRDSKSEEQEGGQQHHPGGNS